MSYVPLGGLLQAPDDPEIVWEDSGALAAATDGAWSPWIPIRNREFFHQLVTTVTVATMQLQFQLSNDGANAVDPASTTLGASRNTPGSSMSSVANNAYCAGVYIRFRRTNASGSTALNNGEFIARVLARGY